MMRFTATWHTTHEANWLKHFSHLAGIPMQAVEIGSFEGLSATWLLQNILTHPNSRLTCFDLWWNTETERLFDANIVETGESHKVSKRKGDSNEMLRYLHGAYDWIYVDACHDAHCALTDAVLAWPRLKKGGYMVFDDYGWEQPENRKHVPPTKPGIDAFLTCFTGQYEALHKGWQVIVRKV